MLTEKLVYIGHIECYERASQMTEMLLGVQVSDSTIYRLTDCIGHEIGQVIDCSNTRKEISLSEDENLYVEVDGSMLLTREQGWKEVKLGRVFKSSSILPESTERQWINDSEYVAHIGGHKDFEDLMSQLIDDPYRLNESQIVFVGDGARWQWSWVESEYPKAVQILDFYHAMEHIGKYIKVVLKKKDEVDQMMKRLGGMLKRKGISTVERYLENIPITTAKQKEEYQKLLTYIAVSYTHLTLPTICSV